jgi:hypothetical protein
VSLLIKKIYKYIKLNFFFKKKKKKGRGWLAATPWAGGGTQATPFPFFFEKKKGDEFQIVGWVVLLVVL